MFDHISLSDERPRSPDAPEPLSPRDGLQGVTSGSASAALKLLDDLCLMANGVKEPSRDQQVAC